MTASLEHVTQWQSLRRVDSAVEDTPLTEYAPSDLTAAVKAKMVKVAPATAILIQPLVTGSDGSSFVLAISGWMDYDKRSGPGPGLKFYGGTVTAGGRVWTADNPLVGGRADGAAGWISAAWRICDQIPGDGTIAADPNYASAFAEVKANVDGILFLPTLGYPYLLAEISSLTNVSRVGLLWRPISLGNVITKTHAYS